ncbi:MAG: prepilin-type N-terminal cleavage/methylation domain-containing protein [Pyrinomonadaceae bacterium]
MKNGYINRQRRESGFSVVELLVVISIIGIVSSIAIFYASAHKKAYQPDDQALQIADILQEARQRALTQRRAMRVEINLTTNFVKLYDENIDSTVATDDVLIKSFNLFAPTNVKVDSRPAEIGYNPAESLPVPNAVFKVSVYPSSISQNVCTIRFLPNGSVVDAGTNAVGGGAVPTGVTLHIWSPNKTTPTQSDIARAITVLGSTGVIRMWEFDHTSAASNKWKDSRRSSSFGATGNSVP